MISIRLGNICIYLLKYIHTYIFIYIHIYMYVYIYLYTYIFTTASRLRIDVRPCINYFQCFLRDPYLYISFSVLFQPARTPRILPLSPLLPFHTTLFSCSLDLWHRVRSHIHNTYTYIHSHVVRDAMEKFARLTIVRIFPSSDLFLFIYI